MYDEQMAESVRRIQELEAEVERLYKALTAAERALWRSANMLDAICVSDTSKDRRQARDNAQTAWKHACAALRGEEVK